MTGFTRWSTATFGAAVCLAGVAAFGVGAAGAGAPNPFRQSSPEVQAATPIVPGTYTWVGDNMVLGTITFAAGHTWSSSYDSDSGVWVQGGRSFAMDMTGGKDGGLGCLFAAKVGVGGTSIVNGSFSCSVTGFTGIWSVSPAASAAAAPAPGDVFTSQGVAPATSIVLGKYQWFIGSHHDGTIKYSAGNAWTSTYNGNGGYWLQGGTTIAMAMTSGGDGTGGCIFAGKVAKTGTAVGSAGKPGAWICPGYSSHGTWYAG